MKDYELSGKLVYLTVHYDRWLREVNSDFNIPMANRMARVIKVFDWETEEGKLLLEARKKTRKWGNFNSEDFKFVLEIYCPELVVSGKKQGFSTEEVAPRKYPGTDLFLFEVVPDWMIKSIRSDEWESFSILPKATKRTQVVKNRPIVKKNSTKKAVKKKIIKKDVSR